MRKGVKLVKADSGVTALTEHLTPLLWSPSLSHGPLLSVVTNKSSLGRLDGIVGLSGHVGTQTQIRDCSNQCQWRELVPDDPQKNTLRLRPINISPYEYTCG
jgi:hypothetical protein